MTKTKYIILVLLLLIVCGCSKTKISIDTKKFKDIVRSYDYKVVSVKQQFSDYKYIKEAYIATNDDNNQIEFYVMQDNENAKAFYDLNKDIIDANRINTSSYKETNADNTDKYVLSTDNYYVISRIDNTVIYITANSKQKDHINKVLKKLGY